jgi:hypothetical protein
MLARTILLAAIVVWSLTLASARGAHPWEIPAEKMHRGLDPVAEVELAAPHDPTFESVARHYPMLGAPREALGVLESAREFIVTRGGEVELNNCQMDRPGQPESYPALAPENKATLFFVLGNTTKTRYGKGNRPDSKRLVDGYLPLVTVPYTYEGIEYRQTLCAWSEHMDPDGRLWAYVDLAMKNPGTAPAEVELSQVALCGRRQIRVTLGNWQFKLAPRQERRLCLRIPRDGVRPDPTITRDSPEFKKKAHWAVLPFCGGFQGVETIDAQEFDRRFAEAAQAWRQRLARAVTIRVPEPRVNDAYRAWLGWLFTNVDKEGERWLPHDGSGFYELVWGIAAIQSCRAFDMYGYPAEAQKYLDSICTLVRPDGELKTAFGLSDSGVLLVALEDHYRYTRDAKWLARAADTIGRVCNWSIARRAREKAGQTPGAPNYGMIKYQPSGDYPEPDYSFLSDTTLCMGLEAAGRALRVVGREAEARRVAAEAADYRRDIQAAMQRAVFQRDGQKLLPILPATRGWLVKANYGATGYYSLFAGLWLDNEFLATDDPYATLLIDALEKRGGLCAGTCTFFDTIDHGFTYGYWLHSLKRNQPQKAILGLYGSMAYGMSRSTYAGVECTNIETGGNALTLPHLRSGTQQLRLLRMMLVREQGDHLLLAQAAPQHWFKPGQQVAVQNAPTAFGPVSYTIRSAVDQGRVTVQLTPPRRNPPKDIRLFVRHPEGKPIQQVLANGQPLKTFDAGSVTLATPQAPITVELRYGQP